MISKEDRDLQEETLEEIEVFSGDLLRLAVNRVRIPGGSESKRELVHHPGGVVVLPILTDKRKEEEEIVLVKQYREPAGRTLWELPAGTLEDGEVRVECARRELMEETNFRPNRLEEKVDLFTSPGYSDEVLSLFVATGLEKLSSRERLEVPEDENLMVDSFPAEELIKMACRGEISDGKTLAGLFFLLCD